MFEKRRCWERSEDVEQSDHLVAGDSIHLRHSTFMKEIQQSDYATSSVAQVSAKEPTTSNRGIIAKADHRETRTIQPKFIDFLGVGAT